MQEKLKYLYESKLSSVNILLKIDGGSDEQRLQTKLNNITKHEISYHPGHHLNNIDTNHLNKNLIMHK